MGNGAGSGTAVYTCGASRETVNGWNKKGKISASLTKSDGAGLIADLIVRVVGMAPRAATDEHGGQATALVS